MTITEVVANHWPDVRRVRRVVHVPSHVPKARGVDGQAGPNVEQVLRGAGQASLLHLLVPDDLPAVPANGREGPPGTSLSYISLGALCEQVC